MTAFETIMVERPEPRIARIVMNRPDAIKVIILAGSGPHFSAGHDLRPGGVICR